MNLPFIIKKGLTQEQADKWRKQFVDNKRTVFESIWRRTQDERNANLSGWRSSDDKRRRMIHFYDQYEVKKEKEGYTFELVAPYLWLSLAFPKTEISLYKLKINSALQTGGWVKDQKSNNLEEIYTRGDIILIITNPLFYKQDKKANRVFPDGYRFLDITLTSKKTQIPKDRLEHPWSVLNTGIRKKDKAGCPRKLVNLKELEAYLPMQLELGCGPSVELGIPPLHYLHKVYSVSDPITHKFVMSPDQDRLISDLFSNPEEFFLHSSVLYLQSIVSVPNEFFLLLKELESKQLLVGDVITNNFDGLVSLVGLKERYVRQYEEMKIIPHIDFHPKAKSLFVIGTHADRRRIQRSARDHGLKIIYVDPEGYYENGIFRSYPLESPQDNDFLVKMTATDFAREFRKVFWPNLKEIN